MLELLFFLYSCVYVCTFCSLLLLLLLLLLIHYMTNTLFFFNKRYHRSTTRKLGTSRAGHARLWPTVEGAKVWSR